MELGVHLPLMPFGGDRVSADRVRATVDAAVEHGYAAVTANDHLVFQSPWLDGLTALASVIDRSGALDLATTVTLSVVRGPAALAKSLAALDLLSGGRLVPALGPGSSARDYELAGVPFEERWPRFEDSVRLVRAALDGAEPPLSDFYPFSPEIRLEPRPQRRVPLWIGSWGSAMGLRRVRRLGDGWLASAYNTTPEVFADARSSLPAGFPNALATMWTWVTDDQVETEQMLAEVLAPLLRRDPQDLRRQVCVGTPEHCAQLLSSYAEAGCQRVYLWPLGDEPQQLAKVSGQVVPQMSE